MPNFLNLLMELQYVCKTGADTRVSDVVLTIANITQNIGNEDDGADT